MFDPRQVLGDESLERLKRKRAQFQSKTVTTTMSEWKRHAGLLREEGGVRAWLKQLPKN